GLAATFLVLYRLPEEPKRWAIYPAVASLVLAVLGLSFGGSWVLPLALVGVGVYLLYRRGEGNGHVAESAGEGAPPTAGAQARAGDAASADAGASAGTAAGSETEEAAPSEDAATAPRLEAGPEGGPEGEPQGRPQDEDVSIAADGRSMRFDGGRAGPRADARGARPASLRSHDIGTPGRPCSAMPSPWRTPSGPPW
ncbi:MAG: hypothetical protein P8Z81_07925, partial [Deinococcales bacterium]